MVEDFLKGDKMANNNEGNPNGAREHFEIYWRYASVLRNWLVAFGVGGCILFVSDKAKIFQDVCHHKKVWIIASFMIGVIAQIVLALINKWTQWSLYRGEEKTAYQKTWMYKIADQISEKFWIDVLADLVTVIAFAIATVCVFKVLF